VPSASRRILFVSGAVVVVLMLVTYIPAISLWLPRWPCNDVLVDATAARSFAKEPGCSNHLPDISGPRARPKATGSKQVTSGTLPEEPMNR